MKKIRGARANRTGGASIDGYNSQSPREQWRYRLRLLSFFQGERRRGISALFMRSSGVKFAGAVTCKHTIRLSQDSV